MKGYRPLKQSKKAKNRMRLIIPRPYDIQRIGRSNWFKSVKVER